MRGFQPGRLALALLCVFTLSGLAFSADPVLVSTMRNVNAVMEAQGFRINPAFEHSGHTIEGDLGPVQAFEIMRPDGKAFTIGRLYTSCTCIQLEAPKRSFADGERAILQLRNIRPTPTNGQIYAIYVQITGPVRATLRYDTFVQSNHPVLAAAAENQEEGEEVSALPPIIENELDPETFGAESIEVIDLAAKAQSEQPDEAEAPAEEDTPAPAAESADMVDQFDAIAREADARVEAAAAAASSMAASMDDYFAEVGNSIAEALPPPDADEVFPPKPIAAPAAAESALVANSATRLEEAFQSAAVPVEPDAIAPVSGKKPFRNISLITIGVRDLFRSMRFYQDLGWKMAPRSKYDQTAFFQLNGQVLVLYPMTELLREQGMKENLKPTPGGITLAIHVGSKEEVQEIYRTFVDAGGVSLKEPTEMISGSVTSYVADPDGNAWEISWVPQFKVDADGWLWLNN